MLSHKLLCMDAEGESYAQQLNTSLLLLPSLHCHFIWCPILFFLQIFVMDPHLFLWLSSFIRLFNCPLPPPHLSFHLGRVSDWKVVSIFVVSLVYLCSMYSSHFQLFTPTYSMKEARTRKISKKVCKPKSNNSLLGQSPTYVTFTDRLTKPLSMHHFLLHPRPVRVWAFMW